MGKPHEANKGERPFFCFRILCWCRGTPESAKRPFPCEPLARRTRRRCSEACASEMENCEISKGVFTRPTAGCRRLRRLKFSPHGCPNKTRRAKTWIQVSSQSKLASPRSGDTTASRLKRFCSKGYTKVVKQLFKSRPTVFQTSSKTWFKSRPTVIQKSSNTFPKIVKQLFKSGPQAIQMSSKSCQQVSSKRLPTVVQQSSKTCPKVIQSSA